MNTLKFGNGEWYGKKDSILAYNDENSNFKPLPFSFDRASSATVINKDGLIETVGSGEPRIDYKDDSKGALLLEPSRTNSLLQSNQFDTTWLKNNVTILGGQSGIYGSSDAWLLQRGDGLARFLYQNVSISSSSTLSIYAKKGNSDWLFLSSGAGENKYFDLENGVIGNVGTASDSQIEAVGDGWYRCSITVSNGESRIYPAIGDGAVSGLVGANIYIQSAQLEQGSYATSYIPTSGGAVTRTDDACSQTPPSGVIGQTEGTIFVDVDFKTLSDTNMFVSIRPDASNKIEIYRSDAIIYGEFSSSTSFNFNKPSVTVGRYKIAVAYSSGSSAMYINGVLIASNTTAFAFTSTLDGIYINSRGTSFIEQSNYNDIKLYNTRLSNAELQALTTI